MKISKTTALFFIIFFPKLSSGKTLYNYTVSPDGSGNFRTIGEAVAAAPSSSERRFFIHVKKGAYKERVIIPKDKVNLAIVGDGVEKTRIEWGRSNATGFGTIDTATFGVDGDGFLAQDIAIANTAGPAGHQAVALRSDSHRSVFYRCRIEGYQDTLYVHRNVQFFRDCEIFGTIDFIFGLASVVFQNYKIYARSPLPYSSSVTITSDGRTFPAILSGIVIHNCIILGTRELMAAKKMVSSYLGRPWRPYATTIIMQSFIDDFISPQGWSPWSGGNMSTLSTLTYGEYENKGPGSSITGRVKWPGFKAYNKSNDVLIFMVENFINGSEWIPATGVPFVAGLV